MELDIFSQLPLDNNTKVSLDFGAIPCLAQITPPHFFLILATAGGSNPAGP